MTWHYHGTPITPREELYTVPGRCFCVPYPDPRDVSICHQIGQSVMLDNGAFTYWRQGLEPDWDGYYKWAEPWLDWPNTWAVIPDVIDGDADDNDKLLVAWFQTRLPNGVPVWHMHEPLERLQRLVHGYGKVCIGSSGAYAELGTAHWNRRMTDAFNHIADDAGRVPWVHMLRGMELCASVYPFASVDSANGARNHKGSWRQKARPLKAMLDDMDAIQTPGRWQRDFIEQLTLPAE